MNIREDIGKRIANARKKAGLTIKELAAKTKELKPSRISNWEQGTRLPGPEEIKEIAELLSVSPAYLLCLTNDEFFGASIETNAYCKKVPIIPLSAIDTKSIDFDASEKQILIGNTHSFHFSDEAFAFEIPDSSMQPEFSPGDVVIVDPARAMEPGNYVIAFIKADKKAIFRKYVEHEDAIELAPLNKDWASKKVKSSASLKVIGVVVEHHRYF